MKSIKVKRVKELKGIVKISGSKNAAIPIICTSIITKDIVKLKNIPRISDLLKLLKILKYLNCKIKFKGNTLKINSKNIKYKPLTIKECGEIRGSYYLIPAMLYLFNQCEILLPGGCNIGKRPIDAHISVFNAMGYKTNIEDNILKVEIEKNIKEFHYAMTKPSVGASINALLCALKCDYAVIESLVLEPEGLDLIEYLKCLGFQIDTLNNKCVFKGYKYSNKKIVYDIIPDRMEAMTFIVMGLLCGSIKVKNVNIHHIKYPLDLLIQSNYNLKIGKNYIKAVKSRGNSFDVKTDIYPLFPTDMQPIIGVLLAYSRGSCVIEETIFENRLQIYKDLIEVGASINIIDNKAYIIGGATLKPGNFKCLDLRHSAAVMLLALKNGGIVENIQLLQRGYEDFFYKIKLLGANFSLK